MADQHDRSPTGDGDGDRDSSVLGQVRRWAWRHAVKLILAFLTVAATMGWTILRGVFAAPAQLAAMTPQLEAVKAQSKATADEVRDMGDAVWVQTALACLALPRGDSTIAMTRLPCGKAYIRSGINAELRR